MTLRIGHIGTGLISRHYLRAYDRRGTPRLIAVCDCCEERLASLRAAGLPAFRDYRELLQTAPVEAVVITVPNDLHYEVCRAALLAGKHVCCEKPLTLRTGEAAELTELARAQGLVLMTAFHRRYNRNVLAALRAVPSPGAVRHITVRYWEKIEDHVSPGESWNLDPARCGGGCIADNGPNAFDTVRLFLGPVRIIAAVIDKECDGIDLEARVALVGESGGRADVSLDWAFGAGECKTLEVTLADGRRVAADMIAGFRGFKSSLDHEYCSILHEFARRVACGETSDPTGLDAVWLVEQAYALARRDDREGTL